MKAIKILEAQEKLFLLKVADWPNLKKDYRSALGKELHKAAYPANYSKNVRRISTKELADIMAKR